MLDSPITFSFSLLAAVTSPGPAPLALSVSLVIGSYLVGSIPTAYWMGLARGIDIRKHGSGNVGATNALRVLGKKLGILCLALDMLKGAVPVLVAAALLPTGWAGSPYVLSATALAAIIGHIFTIFLRFKGGKGVASTLGAMLALDPGPVALAIVIGVVIIWVWRYVSLGSLTIAALIPGFMALAAWRNGTLGDAHFQAPFLLAVLLAIFIFAKHAGNIRRLLDGTERRLGASREDAPTMSADGGEPA